MKIRSFKNCLYMEFVPKNTNILHLHFTFLSPICQSCYGFCIWDQAEEFLPDTNIFKLFSSVFICFNTKDFSQCRIFLMCYEPGI